MRIHGKTFLLILLLPVFTVSVHATPLHNDMGLSAPDVLIEFNELGLPADTPITNQYSSYGVIFSPNLYQAAGGVRYPHFTDGHLRNYFVLDGLAYREDPFTVYFSRDISAVAFAMVTGLYGANLKAYYRGELVEESLAPTADDIDVAENYYGLTDVLIDRLVIDVGVYHENPVGMFMDKLQYNKAHPIPEPATRTLFAVSLFALVIVSRRKIQWF